MYPMAPVTRKFSIPLVHDWFSTLRNKVRMAKKRKITRTERITFGGNERMSWETKKYLTTRLSALIKKFSYFLSIRLNFDVSFRFFLSSVNTANELSCSNSPHFFFHFHFMMENSFALPSKLSEFSRVYILCGWKWMLTNVIYECVKVNLELSIWAGIWRPERLKLLNLTRTKWKGWKGDLGVEGGGVEVKIYLIYKQQSQRGKPSIHPLSRYI